MSLHINIIHTDFVTRGEVYRNGASSFVYTFNSSLPQPQLNLLEGTAAYLPFCSSVHSSHELSQPTSANLSIPSSPLLRATNAQPNTSKPQGKAITCLLLTVAYVGQHFCPASEESHQFGPLTCAHMPTLVAVIAVAAQSPVYQECKITLGRL